jgi:hypothetical protein
LRNGFVIFALREDGALEVFETLDQVRTACEGIDVESGVWDFYGDNGEPLTPVSITPNKTSSHLFGLFSTVVSSQNFDLKPVAGDTEPSLSACLGPDTPIEPNPWFSSVADVRAYLASATT